MQWKQLHGLKQKNGMMKLYTVFNDHSDCRVENAKEASKGGVGGLLRKRLHWSWWKRTRVWNQDLSNRVGERWADVRKDKPRRILGYENRVWWKGVDWRCKFECLIRVLIIRMATGMGRITQGENTEEREEESQV